MSKGEVNSSFICLDTIRIYPKINRYCQDFSVLNGLKVCIIDLSEDLHKGHRVISRPDSDSKKEEQKIAEEQKIKEGEKVYILTI